MRHGDKNWRLGDKGLKYKAAYVACSLTVPQRIISLLSATYSDRRTIPQYIYHCLAIFYILLSRSFSLFAISSNIKMHLILTGATGLVGSGVLHHMINTPAVTAVSVLSRKPVPQAEGHAKVKVIIHDDFNSYPTELLEQLRGAEGCVWAQGISIMKVTKESVLYFILTFVMLITCVISGNIKRSRTTGL